MIQKELEEIKNSTHYWEKIKNDDIHDIINKSKDYIFGNYNKFYYNKFLENFKDSRINHLENEWFKNKRCLDIGCNDGTLTLLIAHHFEPKLIEGIDIDYQLIKTAIKNVKHIQRNKLIKQVISQPTNINKIFSEMESMPKSFIYSLDYNDKLFLERKEKLFNFSNESDALFDNIMFMKENYVSEIKEEETYDLIMCMNTAKWIHLNYGDVGIKILFYNVYSQLKKGGIFLFQFQNWKSYIKRQNLSRTIQNNFSRIKIKPDDFKKYLESIYKFELISTNIPPSNSKKNYERPIYVFKKI
jgi:7SK snRNA methylphosphate capping enzyme